MNNRNPIVTVLMPVYNGEKYLADAIESILNQTYNNFEFIIIDDCSTDNSLRVICSYLDDRIRLIKNKSNIGQSSTMNKGIKLSKGKYIVRLDQDDLADLKRLEKQVQFICRTNSSIVGSWSQIIDQNGNINGYIQHPVDPSDILNSLCINVPFLHSSVIMDKEAIIAIGCYSEEYLIAMDWHLWIKAANHGLIINNIPEILVSFRKHAMQTTINKKMMEISCKENIRLLKLSRKLLNNRSYFKASMAWEYHNRLKLDLQYFKDDNKIKPLMGNFFNRTGLFEYIKLVFFHKIINRPKYLYTPPYVYLKAC